MAELPSKWTKVRLGQLVEFVTSGSRNWSRFYSESGARFIRVGDLKRENIVLNPSRAQRVDVPEGAEGKRTRIQTGDLLVSITADIGMVGVVSDDLGEGYVSQHIALVRPAELLFPDYLAWYLASPLGQLQLRERSSGAVKSGLTLDDIRQINIPLAPLAEQYRIVSIITHLLGCTAQAESAAMAAYQQINQISGAAATAAVAGALTESWRVSRDKAASELGPHVDGMQPRLRASNKTGV